VHLALLIGQRTILLERFDAAQVADVIERYRVHCGTLVPTMMFRLARLPGIEGRDFSSIVSIYHGGAACAPWLKRKWIDLIGAEKLYEGFGSTEAVGETLIRGDEWLQHPGSVGRGVYCDIRILGPDREDVPAGVVGEIFMRWKGGPRRTYRYVGQPQAETTPDGFASVGDLGWLDADGYLYVADRRTDMIISGGANIYPAEVEAALLQHPAIGDVAVIGLPDEEWGKRVHAIVVPAGPGDPPTSAALDTHCRSLIARYKVPKSYEFVPELPRNDVGKIRKSDLVAARAGTARPVVPDTHRHGSP
jgi:bile acid-coenzyme A ligase